VKVELSRFRVKPGKSPRVNEWLKALNDGMTEIVPLLDREEMKVEVIFREMIDGEEYLYWFSVQGDAGKSANDLYELGRKHMEFHEECIEHDYGMRNAQPQVVMVPKIVAEAMNWDNPATSVASFQPRELIYRRKA
jgi:hypothetical protein